MRRLSIEFCATRQKKQPQFASRQLHTHQKWNNLLAGLLLLRHLSVSLSLLKSIHRTRKTKTKNQTTFGMHRLNLKPETHCNFIRRRQIGIFISLLGKRQKKKSEWARAMLSSTLLLWFCFLISCLVRTRDRMLNPKCCSSIASWSTKCQRFDFGFGRDKKKKTQHNHKCKQKPIRCEAFWIEEKKKKMPQLAIKLICSFVCAVIVRHAKQDPIPWAHIFYIL